MHPSRRRRWRTWLLLVLLPMLPVLGLRASGAIGDNPKLPLNDLNTALGVSPRVSDPARGG